MISTRRSRTLKSEFADCPFCPTKLTNFVTIREDDNPPPIGAKKKVTWFYAHCNMCGARGPSSVSKAGAKMRWNKALRKLQDKGV